MFESFKNVENADKDLVESRKIGEEKILPYSFNEKEKVYKRMFEIIDRFHNKNVKAIFLTWTSATLFGWTLKEAWKKAFPGENIPDFYFINPKPWRYKEDHEGHEKELEKLRKIGEKELERIKKTLEIIFEKDKDAKIGVFDEAFNGGQEDSHFWKSADLAEGLVRKEMNEIGVKDIDGKRVILDGLGVKERSNPYDVFGSFSDEVNKKEARKFATGIKYDKNINVSALTEKNAIEVFKKIGEEIGEKMHKELEDKTKKH
jgi:hypothetical protein